MKEVTQGELAESLERTRSQMKGIAEALEEILKHVHEKRMGFALLVYEFNNPGIGNYISNSEREDMIKALRETADRLEANEVYTGVGSMKEEKSE